ncbi:MAG: hypothetical protein ACRCUT_00925, partial [Spirochaetota bacterium]
MNDFYNSSMAEKIIADPVDVENPETTETPDDPVPDDTAVETDSLFLYGLGTSVSPLQLSDLSIADDYDGDGIVNSLETTTNPYVADYPKIVTRIETPISIEIRGNSTSTDESFEETISGSETKDTISNSMESKQYNMANKKTTPYVSKEAYSSDVESASAYGYSDSTSKTKSGGGGINIPCGGLNANASVSTTKSNSENASVSNKLAQSTSTEKTVFQDVDYVDNMDRSGVELSNDKVQTMTSNYRKSGVSKNTTTIGPNAGIVSSCLYIHNLSVNFPVRVSDVKCTLSFRTPSGQCQAVKTFILRNDDYSLFAEDIYGDEEKGPYAIVIDGLNTNFIKKALENGWVPQIHVVSYDTSLVKDSNYNPGVDNLQIVQENAKGRTAFITIKGEGLKESYRVAAFDQQGSNLVPGISLKKALFNIMADRIGSGENWTSDRSGKGLTIPDTDLTWMKGGPSSVQYSSNTRGNSWRSFETCVKEYSDDEGKTCRIETIKTLFSLTKYNPFDSNDNPNYNPSERLSDEEMEKMQYWMIFHDGKYYEGDLNDPIWPGERYEIVCVNIGDFNSH